MNQAEDKEIKWPFKDRVIFFLMKLILVPIVIVCVIILAIREEIEKRRSYGRRSDKDTLPKP